MEQNFARRFVWIVCLSEVFVGSNRCFAAQEDAVTSFTGGSQSFITQFLGISERFPSIDRDQNNPLTQLDGDDKEAGVSNKKKLSPLTWNIGLGYSHLTSPATTLISGVSDNVISGQVGIGWDISNRFMASANVGLDSIPEEHLRHGWAVLRFEYMWTLGGNSKKDEDEDDLKEDPNDASEYYKEERDKKMRQLEKKWELQMANTDEEAEEQKRVKNTYPQLRVAYNLGFNTDSSNALSQVVKLNQYQYGPEVSYAPKPGVVYKIMASYYIYSNNVNTFLPLIKLGNSSRVPLIPYNGISASSNQILSFPSWYFGLGAHWALGSKNGLDVNFANILYSSQNQPTTYSIYPVFTRTLNNNWNAGVGADATLGSGTVSAFGSLSLTYKL